MWNKKISQSISSGDSSVNLQAGRDINLLSVDFPTTLVDQKINEELSILRRSRFFIEFDRVNSTLTFGRRLVEGDLLRGTDAVRRTALAWCARLLSRTDELDTAEEYLKLAKSLGASLEIEISKAFILSQKGNKRAALDTLAGIDSPISRTAAFMIVEHHDGGEQAIDWLKKAGIETTRLDAEGKYFLLATQLNLGHWYEARENLDALIDYDFEDAPVLHHISAITQLLSAVPIELRTVVLNQFPFEAASFPLSEDVVSMEARKTAQRHFSDAVSAAQRLNCHRTAMVDEEYALWLELMDPENADVGKRRLEDRLRNPKSALRLVPLGLQFGIKLDLVTVEQEIDRDIALRGGITPDTAIARFALAFAQKTPKNVVNYVDRHYDELSKYFDPKSLRFLQIEMLSRAGLPERANELLNLLIDDGLSKAEESRLRRIISEAEGTDPVEARKAQFKQTNALWDLVNLIDELERKQDWSSVCEYGASLFERTKTVRNAERFANALSNSQRSEELVEFLSANSDLLSLSRTLQLFYAWALYHEGALVQARAELTKLIDDQDNPSYRLLEINLAIVLGDWDFLLTIVADEYAKREKRSAHELLGAAQLALNFGSHTAENLIFAAAAKADDDAAILASAYFLATSAGLEGNKRVVQWLHKAAELSGDNGPIQKLTLKDFLDRKPDWDRRGSETWQLLSCGEIPMFLAAQFLNRCLVDLMLLPAFANLSESDPRRKSIIPAYSGKHFPVSFDLMETTIGIDATALLTLSYLNLLETALDTFKEIYVPHSTLVWLFEEKQRAAFHQPSRIRDAHKLRDLLARGLLEKLVASTIADCDLSAQIGDELALMITEAEKGREDDDIQRIVIRSSPVHRLSSLLQEEADLSCHAAVMSSCLAIVEKLREKGQITAEEEKRARAYLQLQEKPWPTQPEIRDGATLFLDGLAITYFLHIGILEKLHVAGFRVIVSPSEVSEVNALIAYQRISDKAIEAIEHIRSAVNSRIVSGKIKVGKQYFNDEPKIRSISEHPTFGVIALTAICNAVISDDRFLNQHAHADDGKVQIPIITTLDLLDALALAGIISAGDLMEYRTLLRRAGYLFVPMTEDELTQHLNASPVKGNKVIETAELKAIRECLLRVRMSNWLQLPKEAPWLDRILKVFDKVLKGLWSDGADLTEIKVRSNWIVDQVDIRGWAHALGSENGVNLIKSRRGAHIRILATPPCNAPQSIKDAYCEWIEDRFLAPIKEQFPELYAWIAEHEKILIAKLSETEMSIKEST
ncbi:PIN domain-containing protein [Nitrosomonas sp. Is37]|uniref:HTH domain-containing protein n=1 Tax=Nitrosomonas sp. Is37 TaxID=3080535 RepID=UPI00294B7C90|nr:hypothetical protein [Nitrosomonas sp. Is37]MDV6345585.1 hypothetical protein [Nitrosomonas sp. Is37]